MIVPMKLAFS